jgi:hypothetical protein
VADTSYADCDVQIDLVDGAGASAPELEWTALRDPDGAPGNLVRAGAPMRCALPTAPDAALSAQRRGAFVELRRGGASATCEVGSGALRLGLRAPPGVDVAVRSLRLRR